MRTSLVTVNSISIKITSIVEMFYKSKLLIGYFNFLIHPFILSQEQTVSNVTNIYYGIEIEICSVFFYTRFFKRHIRFFVFSGKLNDE